ncbi:hypothetical protein RF11_06208 [Thelohanellus kitauei]|uniref:Uncharacterized protein n=1 Tax=Thelohanellus kitauei TaxID=669202 RepID=A0A0C2J3N7_THEKT|nr:hypothetical protein RF11_06208 [Thelohanellus kitauei]
MWLDYCHMPIKTTSRLTATWKLTNPPRHDVAMESIRLAHPTVVDWFSFCLEVYLHWCDKNSTCIGGPGSVVGLDEAKIGQKNTPGGWLEGYLIFRGYETSTKNIFVEQDNAWNNNNFRLLEIVQGPRGQRVSSAFDVSEVYRALSRYWIDTATNLFHKLDLHIEYNPSGYTMTKSVVESLSAEIPLYDTT